jgi:hypothetical protein
LIERCCACLLEIGNVAGHGRHAVDESGGSDQRFKDEVKEVPVGQECGMAFEDYHDLKQGDTIECFRTHIETRRL